MTSEGEPPDDDVEFTYDGVEVALDLVRDSHRQALQGLLQSLLEGNVVRYQWHGERTDHLEGEIRKLNVVYEKILERG